MRTVSKTLLAFSLALHGCDTGGSDDSGADASSGATMGRCAGEDRADPFMFGFSKSGDSLSVAIVDAMPPVPTRFDNVWVMHVTDDSGAAMDGMELAVLTWMPDHGHGSPQDVVVTAMGAGDYQLDLNLHMSGFWEVTVDFSGNGASDQVVFNVCVE